MMNCAPLGLFLKISGFGEGVVVKMGKQSGRVGFAHIVPHGFNIRLRAGKIAPLSVQAGQTFKMPILIVFHTRKLPWFAKTVKEWQNGFNPLGLHCPNRHL